MAFSRVMRASRERAAIAFAVALGTVVLVGSAFASATSDKPDLVPLLPTTVPQGVVNVAPVYMDTYTRPGHVLYRFNTVIKNLGGTMDLFMQDGAAYQGVWTGGVPTTTPDPNVAPSGSAVTIENRSATSGASFVYSAAAGHNHWHFQNAALYQLLLPDGTVRVSDKIGFCMYDTWPSDNKSAPRYFVEGMTGVGPNTWCAKKQPTATFTREGISPTYGDLYEAQAAWQWVDVTGLTPGTYQLRATVNPYGYIDESDPSNNTITVDRTIPGTIAETRSRAVVANTPKKFLLNGQIVGIDVPAWKGVGTCAIRADLNCYVFDQANGPLTFTITQQPAHGTVALKANTGLGQNVTYTPAAGFTGKDTFTYTVTDARGLTSQPGTITLNVS